MPPDPEQSPRCAGGRCEGHCSLRPVPGAMDDVVRALALLEGPAAITENRAARLTQVGAYGPVSTPDGPLPIEPGRVSLRLDPDALTGAVIFQPAHAVPGEDPMPELRLCGAGGRAVHRCYPLLGEDRLVLEGLTRLDGRLPGESLDVYPRPRARELHDLPDQLQRIDDLLTWTTARTAFLPHRHIEPGVLTPVIEHACAVGLPLGFAVFSDAVMHVIQNTVHSVEHAAGITAVGTGEAILEFRPTAVHHCLLLRLHGPHGPTSSLELYDGADRRVGLISQFGIVETGTHDAWEHLAASLPELT